MPYDPELLVVNKLTGGGLIGYSFVIGQSLLGTSNDDRVRVNDYSAFTLTPSAYTVEDGALSLDPATATASFAVRRDTPAVTDTPFEYGDRIEITYDDVEEFTGTCTGVEVDVECDDTFTNKFDHHYAYTFRSVVAYMLDRRPPFGLNLPAQTALARLQEFFTVDYDQLDEAQVEHITGLLHEATDNSGSMTYLEHARAFTALTGVPVRVKPNIPAEWNVLEVMPEPITWDGALPTPEVSSDDDGGAWVNAVHYTADETTGGVTVPTSVKVTANDTRFLEGFTSIAITPTNLGDFIIGVSRIGSAGSVDVGFGAGTVVDVDGRIMAVARVTHTFGHTKYAASLELARPLSINVVV